MGSQDGARRLLILSSPSNDGDQDSPPDIAKARGGAFGTVRSLLKKGAWPEDLDLLVLSDSYGLVRPLSGEDAPVPVPFSRQENAGWWEGFVSRNLDNYVSRRGYSDAFAVAREEHAQALYASRELRRLDTVWAETGSAGLRRMKEWVSGGQEEPDLVGHSSPDSHALHSAGPATANGKHPGHLESSSPAWGTSPAFVNLIHDSLYTSRTRLVASRLQPEALQAVRDDLALAWSQRAARRRVQPSVSNLVTARARLPWSQKPAVTLYRRLFESFGMQSVLGSVNKAVTQLALTQSGRYSEILSRIPRDESQFIADVLFLMWEASCRMDKDEIAVLRTYLTDECDHDELRRLGMPRNLPLEDRYEVLRAVLACMCGPTPGDDLTSHRRVWIWLDEIENLLGYEEQDHWEVVKGLETLLGDSRRYVTVWMNISPGSSGNCEQIQAVLENALVVTDDLTELSF